jgi:hypothetical protein
MNVIWSNVDRGSPVEEQEGPGIESRWGDIIRNSSDRK